MPSRACASFLRNIKMSRETWKYVSMPSRASAPFLPEEVYEYQIKSGQVSMPFRASVPFLRYVDLVVYS